VGFWEVFLHYPFFRRLFESVLDWIAQYRPKRILLVDYPGFNLRLAEALYQKKFSQKAGGTIGIDYYISPQIWAWKAKRRFKMQQYVDRLAVLFPFEVDCFRDTSLPVTFVGHPFMAEDYRLPVHYDAQGPILFLPGSRKAAVKRIFPLMLKGYEAFLNQYPVRGACVIYPSARIQRVLEDILKAFPRIAQWIQILPKPEQSIGTAAILSSSGTMSLNCALAGIPGAIVYKAASFTYYLGRYFIQVPYLGMANLLLGRPVYPEYIQSAATPSVLASQLHDCLYNPDRLKAIQQDIHSLQLALGKGQTFPSAAEWMMQVYAINQNQLSP